MKHEYILRQTPENLTPGISKALLGFTLSGCDQTGKFPGYSKKSCWDVFVTVPNEALQALTNLGSSETRSVADIKSLELFIIQLYCRDKIPPNIRDLAALKWHMFSKQQLDSKKWPPISEEFL